MTAILAPSGIYTNQDVAIYLKLLLTIMPNPTILRGIVVLVYLNVLDSALMC